MWHLEDDSSVPPLPARVTAALDQASRTSGDTPGVAELLRPGCWLVKLDPEFADDYEYERGKYSYLKGWVLYYRGTLRVEGVKERGKYERATRKRPAKGGDHEDENARVDSVRASGDLYVKRQVWHETPVSRSPPRLRPRQTVPIFPRRDYSYYFTVSGIAFKEDAIELRLASFRFQSADETWGKASHLTARLTEPDPVPKRWRGRPNSYLTGPVINDRGNRVGKLELGWITDRLRRATVEVDVVEGLKDPHLDNGEGETLKTVFEKVDWDVHVREPEVIPNDRGEVWKDSVLHAKLLEWRSSSDLDSQWLYHVLVVPRFKQSLVYGWGREYDKGAIDVNLVPREGVVVAARSKFPDDPVAYGSAADQFMEDVKPAFFHAVVHELGHAMGLSHRFLGASFMQGLVYVAEDPDALFPDDLQWYFHPEDVYRLRHYPDIQLRPGGVPFEHGFSSLPVPEVDAVTDARDAFELKVAPTSHVLPLGCPLRIHLRLTNKWSIPLTAPRRIALSEGSVAGRVIGPGSEIHRFATATRLRGSGTSKLPPGESRYHAETLLRGPKGALFPSPGRYIVEINAFWRGSAGIAHVSARTDILVMAADDGRHAETALALLGSRELVISLIFRTSPESLTRRYRRQVQAGIDALQLALSVDQLRPHYEAIEARRLAELSECWLEKAAGLIESASVLTAPEIEGLLELVKSASEEVRKKSAVRRMIAILQVKAETWVALDLASPALLKLIKSVQPC